MSKRTIEEAESFYVLRYGRPPDLAVNAKGRAAWFTGLEDEVLLGCGFGRRVSATHTIQVPFSSVQEPDWVIFKKINDYYERLERYGRG